MRQSNDEIVDICEDYDINNYKINPNGSIDIDGDVDLAYRKLTELPLKFNRVTGDFDCSGNELTSLKHVPNYVGDCFSCSYNKLTSLRHRPKYIEGYFYCENNPLDNTKENLEILSKYNYDLDYYKCYSTNLYNMIIIAKRNNSINNILL